MNDHVETEINSLLDVQIQQEILLVLSDLLLDVLISVIPPQTTTTTTTPLTTPIPTPIITSTTPPVTSLLPATETLDAPIPPSEALTAVLQRVSKLEKDVKELKQVNYSTIDMDRVAAAMGESSQFKRKHEDKDEDPTAGLNQGKDKKRPRKDTKPSKKSSESKDSSKGNTPPKSSKSGKSVTAKEPNEEHMHDMLLDAKENIVDETSNVDEHPDGEATPKNDWFKQPPRPPTSDPEFGLTNLQSLKGTCQSSIELEYNMEECYKSLTDKLDWKNPKGDRCPFELSKPLPLKGHPRHLIVSLKYFFNNNLEYLKSTDSERKYTTSITKTKAARYELVGIEHMLPKSQLNRFSKHDVYSPLKILTEVLDLQLVLLCRDTNKVCVLCEVILKQIPPFDFFCASLESISAIEDTWERGEVWEDIQVVPGFVGRERGLLGK
ncbi:hypothetical protein Tco_0820630 [Tanacetum coccineum]|uniref:Uncharacterized protein n=1 Tax=Tanacetum coccineum TaxID=301880 RepID=A0ABQ5AE78_9ASTR